MAVESSTDLALGTQAPEFALPDTISGRTIRLTDFAASPAVLVAFICNHCPYVIHIRPALVEFAREYQPRGLAVVAISSGVGTALGLLAGCRGGWVDGLIMRVTDIFMSFPLFVVLVILVALLGPSGRNVVLFLALFSWMMVARLVRGQVLAVMQMPYIEATVAGLRLTAENLAGRRNKLGTVLVERVGADSGLSRTDAFLRPAPT